MKKYNMTFIGLVISISIYLITVIFKLDLFETVIETFESFERFEVDEFIIPVFIFLIFSFFDQARKRKLQQIEREKIKIYTTMLSSTHHILNNFLNQVEIFKFTAENTPELEPEVLALYDVAITAVSTQVEALCAITDIDEGSIHASVAPKSNSQPGIHEVVEISAHHGAIF